MDTSLKNPQYYVEIRPTRRTMQDGLATDLARHIYKRQHLGSAVIITDEPLKLLAVVRKQWFKLARNLQRERAGTVNAQKILHLTYAVTRMHNLVFTSKSLEDRPEASVFLIGSEQLRTVPPRCYSLYFTTPLSNEALAYYLAALPTDALIVDYVGVTAHLNTQLRTKAALNERVRTQWQRVVDFLTPLHIDIAELAKHAPLHPSLIDDAIDLLLDNSIDFLHIAGNFQHSLQLAQPLESVHETQVEYNTLTLLAHRVQSLSTGELNDYLDSAVVDNSFFLRDGGNPSNTRQAKLAILFLYHQQAGHTRICRQLDAAAKRAVFEIMQLV